MNLNKQHTMTRKLISTFGEKALYDLWVENNGMYKTAKVLSKKLEQYVSPYVIRYLSNKFNWKRVITDTSLPIYRGVLKGSSPMSYYKHLIFEEPNNAEDRNT